MDTLRVGWDSHTNNGYAFGRYSADGEVIDSGPAGPAMTRDEVHADWRAALQLAVSSVGLDLSEADDYGPEDGGWAIFSV